MVSSYVNIERKEHEERKESGKTLRKIRRAKKLKKKLMTKKLAKKKVALLLQKLKKCNLPELPSPVHDPELFTPEQIQAVKKIGFKNKNYVPVGVMEKWSKICICTGSFVGAIEEQYKKLKDHNSYKSQLIQVTSLLPSSSLKVNIFSALL